MAVLCVTLDVPVKYSHDLVVSDVSLRLEADS